VRLRAELEQAFLVRTSGGIEARLVLVRESGAREREALVLASGELPAAAALLGRTLARRDDIARVAACRVRVRRGGALVDDAALLEALVSSFEDERGAVGDGA
jgi:hypothetical protein